MRKQRRQRAGAVVWSLLLVVAMGSVVFGTGAATPHTEDRWAGMPEGTTFQNFTMHLYSGSTHAPGESEVSIWYEIIVHGLPEDDRRAWLNQSVTATPWVSACELQDLEGFYIDRRPPDNGTGGGAASYSGYDGQVTSVDTNVENTWNGQEGIEKYRHYLGKETNADETHAEFPLSSNGWDAEFIQTSRTKFWDKEQAESDNPGPGGRQDPPRTTFEYENMDRVIVDYQDCYTNPEDPGWYRQASLSETYWFDERDTAPDNQRDGAPENSNFAPVTYSHWVYICDCDSYDAAVQQLGEPPEMNGTKVANPSEFAGYYGQGTEPTPTETDSGEDTPTPTAQETTAGTPQETTAMATTAAETTAMETTAAETTAVETTAAPATETSNGGGPGFGVGVALVALLGAALLGLRRRD